jgi:hypothetical protein
MQNAQPNAPFTIGITAAFCAGLTAVTLPAGSSLAVFFGGIIALAVCVPIGASVIFKPLDRLCLTLLCGGSVGLVWLIPAAGNWLSCTAIALAFAASLAGLTSLLRRLHFNDTFAPAVVILLAIAWLSWPIWLSPALEGRQALVDWLVPAHPLLAINAQVLHLGIWTERPMMYRWTILNQDVSYQMPTNPLWCIIVHLGIGVGAMVTGSHPGEPRTAASDRL